MKEIAISLWEISKEEAQKLIFFTFNKSKFKE